MSAYPNPAPLRGRRARLLAGCALAAAFSSPGFGQAFKATPVITNGGAVINQGQTIPGGLRDTVIATTPQVVIDWTPTDTSGTGAIDILPNGNELRFQVDFADQLPRYTVLNRIIPADPSRAVRIDGFVNSLVDTGYGIANGAIWFYSPGGIIASATSRFDVGSLVLTANDIQIGDFVTEGLFAGQGTDAVAGSIRFRGAADSRSFVTVEAGAKINATGNYVALVAPRVTQNGMVTVNGGAAFVAAEQLDMLIPVSGGLFDIQVSVGTSVDATDETVLTHGGTTTGASGDASFFADRRIHMMAVPKNDAVTMLVAGSVGYAPASQVELVNGDIVLSTGSRISPGGGATSADQPSTIMLTGGSFTSETQLNAGTIDISATTADLTFTDDLFASSVNGLIRARADAGRTIQVGDELVFAHSDASAATGIARIELTALGGGTIKANSIFLGSNANGAFDGGSGVPDEAAGSIAVLADAGTIQTSSLSVNARATGGGSNVDGNNAGSATGGIITIQAKNAGGAILSDVINVAADADGGDAGYGAINGGFGKAGSIVFGASDGATITTNALTLSAVASGGDGQVAGIGTGGTLDLDFSNSVVSAADTLSLSVSGTGGRAPGGKLGGDGLGGTVTLAAAGGSLAFNSIDANADGTGRGTFFFGTAELGGTGKGGAIAIALSSTTLEGANAISVSASGTGGQGSNSGAGLGGAATLAVTNGAALTTDTSYAFTADGTGGEGQVSSGLGKGGSVVLSAAAGTIAVGSLTVSAAGTGGDNVLEGGASGDGAGGSISVAALNAGTLSAGVIDLQATGTSGLETGYGIVAAGSGTGGQIAVKAASGGLIETAGLTGNAIGTGRFGTNSGGAGFGGNITFGAAGGDISVSEGVELFAKGAGGSSNADGGAATGGKIEIAASAGTIDVGNMTGDASATAGSSFLFGSGGAADGGTIKISALGGGTILGLNFFEATGEGGDGNSDATAGFGTGGSVIVRAADGTIDARGGTLSLVANGVGGNGQPISSFVGDTLLARGGTVDIGLTGTGQLLYSTVQALANGRFLNFADGFVSPNHGANAVGGTVLLSAADASLVQGDSVESSISLTATGTGAFSAAGGFGGTGYQGLAEVRVAGGTVDVPFLNVTARAEGGLGNDQNDEGGDDAGSGGFAGVGVSPYMGVGGAIVDVTAGALTASFINIDGSSEAGDGGRGEEFANFTLAGRGGDAIGGTAQLSVTGDGSLTAFGVSLSSDGRGGDGGSVQIFDSGSSDGVMGDGGLGAAGFVLVTLNSSNTVSILDLEVDAVGRGGDGGSFDTGYGGFLGGSGRGGIGGIAFGGSAQVKIASSLETETSISIETAGIGGDGGDGPQGGAAGEGQSGTASLSFLGGTTVLGDLELFSDAFGGRGGDGLGGNAGAAGKGTGFLAELTIGPAATVTVENRLALSASGEGGVGGQGADEVSAAFGGGRGGDAEGGKAIASVSGDLTLLGFSEGAPSLIFANARAGTGGSGGDADGGTGGSGGDGGNAVGGEASFATLDGTVDLVSLQVRADAAGGSAGLAGLGIGGTDGSAGSAQGGAVAVTIDQKNAPGNVIRLGAVDLSTDATLEEFSNGKAGRVSVAAFGGTTPLTVDLESLEITSFGTEPASDGVGLSFAGTGATYNVAFSADMRINGAVIATGTNTLNADSSLLINAGGSIDLGGTNFGGGEVNIDSFGSSLSSNGTIFATNNLSVQAVLGDAFLADLAAGAFASVTAAGSVSIGNVTAQNVQAQAGADGSSGRDLQFFGKVDAADQINVQATRDILFAGTADVRGGGSVFLTAGDDIIIGAGALLRSDSGPPPEAGYGGPLLSLRAGSSSLAAEVPVGDIGSIVVDGGIDFGNGTVVLEGDAIAGSLATGSVRAGNLYADLTDIPPNEVTPLTDLGQLTGKCLQGSVCLGTVQVSRLLAVGDGSEDPLYLRFNPQTDALSVFLQAQIIELGETGVATSLKASDSLQIEALNGDLALAQGLSVAGGASFARLAATNNISGGADVSNAGNTIDVFAGNNMSFGTVSASAIRTVDFDGTVINANGFTAPGKLDIGKVSIGTDVSLLAGTGASLGTADLAPSASLTLLTKAGLARLGGGSLLNAAIAGDSIEVSIAAQGDVFATAANGAATLGTISANLIDVTATQGIAFVDLSATDSLQLDASGPITGGSAAGGDIAISTTSTLTADALSSSGTLDVTATSGISLGSTSSGGATTLFAPSGGVSVKTDAFAGGGITAQGTGVSLIGKNGLLVTSAKSTAGELILVAGGSTLTVGSADATGDAILFSGGDLTVDTLTATGKASLDSALGSVQVANTNAQGGTSASGTSVTLASTSALKVNDAKATSGTLVLTASGDLTADRIASSGAATLTAAGSVQVLTDAATAGGLTATGTTVALAGLNGLTITKVTATAGDIKLTNAAGAVTVGLADTTKALSVESGGSVTVSDVLAPAGVTVTGTAVTLNGSNGLFVQKATATSGDLVLGTGAGKLTLGSLDAAGALKATSAADLSFGALKAGGLLALTAKGDVTGSGQLRGGSISVQTPGRFDLTLDAQASSGTLSILADQGIRAFGLVSASGMTLAAANGVISVENVGGPDIVATGKSVSLAAAGVLDVMQATATAGDVQLGAGVITADAVSASGTASLLANGSIKGGTLAAKVVTLDALGGDIAFDSVAASGDASIFAAGAVLGAAATAGQDLKVTGAQGVSLGTATAGGLVELASSAGAIIVLADVSGATVRASGQSVALTGQSDLIVDTVASSGDIALTATTGTLKVTNAEADGTLVLTSNDAVTFAALSAGNAVTIAAQANVTGGSATAGSIEITTPGALVADDLVATSGTIRAIATKGVTVDTAVSSGTTTLKADQGTVTVASDIRPGEGLIVAAPSISLTGQAGLNIAEANATAGDLVLKTLAGDLIAGKLTAAGAISLDSAGALSFASLTAQQGVTLKAAGDVIGDNVAGTTVAVTAGGTKGITLQSIAATGPVTLGATAGAIQIGNLLTNAAIQATARTIGLGSTGNILLSQASATDGDLTLKSSAGGITLGQVSASKALTADASAGTLTVTGTAIGGTIGFTSADIAIGSGALVGSVGQTGTVTFTSAAARTFIGGTASGTGYRLDASELTRVAARDGFTITTLPTQGSTAFSFIAPDQATMVLDSLSFTGAQLGTNGIFTVDAPRSIGIVGNIEYKNFAAGQSVIYRAGTDISLGAETGLVTLKDSAGALAGTLRLQAPQVIAMSVPARAEIPNLTLNQARQRLGTNDAVQNDGGYFQAGNIDVRIGQLLFIQNSGGNDGLRGFTGNTVRIEATGSSPAQVVVNGRVQAGSGFASDADLADNLTLVGNFDPDSSFGGCALNASSCGGPPPEVADVTFSVARDQIRDEEEEDEQEEALQAAQTRPDPVIQFMTPPSSRFDPLIDEPITGAGNEDLWETPRVPSPGN